MTRIFTGFDLAAALNAETRLLAERLPRRPRCVVLARAGDAPMQAYAARLTAMAGSAGVELEVADYADGDAVRRQIEDLAADGRIDAVAALQPVPAGLRPLEVALAIGTERDVDGQHPFNAGLLALGEPARPPATAQACLLIARALAGSLKGREVVIVGASRIVGRPLASLLLDAEATVRICHAATRDLPSHTREADIIVTAAGAPGLIGAAHVGRDAIVIDVSIRRTADGLVGDVDLGAVGGVAAVVTHVPDGVGPVTTACLLRNVADAAATRNARQAS